MTQLRKVKPYELIPGQKFLADMGMDMDSTELTEKVVLQVNITSPGTVEVITTQGNVLIYGRNQDIELK